MRIDDITIQLLPTNESVCKLVREPGAEKWIHMNNNTWIYTLQAERTLTIVCGRYQKTIKIHKTGILQMDCQCIAKSSTMILRATTKYTTKVKGILLPRVNLTEYTPSTTIKTATQANQIQSNLEHLQNQIDDQRAKENSIKLTGHDIHQYTIGYTTLAILALVIIIYGIKHQRKQRHDILHQHTGSTTNSNSDRPKQLV